MKKIKYVKVIITNEVVEPFLISVKKEFVFYGEYFKECDTIEEIRDKFLEELNPENVVKYTKIFTYTNKTNLNKGKQYEYVGQ